MTWPTKTNFVDGDVLTAAQVNNIGTNLNVFDPTSATAGQTPVADGAGSVAWGTGSGLTVIASATGATGSPISLNNIPSGYKALILTFNNGNALDLLRFNNDSSTAAYRGAVITTEGATQTLASFELTYAGIGFDSDMAGVLQIWNYTSNVIVWQFYGSSRGSSSLDSRTQMTFGTFGPSYAPGGPVTSIQFTVPSGGIDYTLYGVS